MCSELSAAAMGLSEKSATAAAGISVMINCTRCARGGLGKGNRKNREIISFHKFKSTGIKMLLVDLDNFFMYKHSF